MALNFCSIWKAQKSKRKAVTFESVWQSARRPFGCIRPDASVMASRPQTRLQLTAQNE